MRILLFAFLLTAIAWAQASHVSSPDDEGMLVMAAARLPPSEAARMEADLLRRPNDFLLHEQLLAYYSAAIRSTSKSKVNHDADRKLRLDHAYWLIENRPECLMLTVIGPLIDHPARDVYEPGAGEKAQRLWEATLQKRPKDPAVLNNAAQFFQVRDRKRAISLAKRAIQLDKEKVDYQKTLGRLYGAALLGVSEIESNGAPKAVKPDRQEQLMAKRELGATEIPWVLRGAIDTVRFGRNWLKQEISQEEDAYLAILEKRAIKFTPK